MNKEQKLRYRGHISLCEIDLPGQDAICNARVLIVGAGGLGSPVALYLASAGVGNIGIIDADTVSLTNLQRQIIYGNTDLGMPKAEIARRAMLRINPGIEVTSYTELFTPDNACRLVDSYDLIIDCTDNFTSRMLINDTCVSRGKPFIFGAVSRFSGQVFTHIPGTADLRDLFGDEIPDPEEPCSISGILNALVGILGSLQAAEAIKYITSTGELLINRLLVIDALTMQFSTFPICQ